jgi:uncharacterized protein (TIGR02118 family)
MIRVSVLYPNEPGKKFDLDYYVKKHMKLVHDRLDPLGLQRIEVDRGVAGGGPGTPAPFASIGHIYFNSVSDFQNAIGKHGKELFDDVPNFTDIQPRVQISEVIAC